MQAKFSETKSSDGLAENFAGLVTRGNQSTVVLRARQSGGERAEQVAFGTVVGTEGKDGICADEGERGGGAEGIEGGGGG